MKSIVHAINRHPSAVEICVSYLKEVKAYNIHNQILKSENQIIDKLLMRTSELQSVFKELVANLESRQYGFFIDLVLSSAAFWNPDATRKYRDEKARLQEINEKITQKANELSDLLSFRSELVNTSGFSSNTHYSIVDVIDNSSSNNGRYTSFLQEKLKQLSYQFDLKYWPSLSSVVREISIDAGAAEITSTDPMTEASTSTERGSKSDFLKALFAAIDENRCR